MQLENIRRYLEAIESMGVPSGYKFAPEELLEGPDMLKVLENLTVLMKKSLARFE